MDFTRQPALVVTGAPSYAALVRKMMIPTGLFRLCTKICLSLARSATCLGSLPSFIDFRRWKKICRSTYLYGIYSLLSLPPSLVPTSSLALSLMTFRKIFPEGFFGISSTNTTPPANLLCGATLCASHLAISVGAADWSFCRTMYALGSSSPDL